MAMTKAHERDWFYHESTGEIRDREYPDRWIDFSDDEEAGRLAAAAPAMMQVLLQIYENERLSPRSEMLLHEAFRKASVDPG